LLDEARASFGRGEHEAALRTITLHERRYPDSVLTEEREALAIKALVASRNYEKAKAMGARFAERYPRSLLLPAVRDALGSIP
jgi:outer membrane protein assembly factor BamD (BamD/ComL family)